ncbi:hypothetical protein GCM10007049_35520 [Echinicola pacifica]|uniref:DUF4625 domain-containing protein n=2 Tax=Echinicola pacifica TaxID=346377 RepID=A0A918QA98_9BACT|nr:hypothetical protein GCM10007049_35520 [Echinicola pacifica]
MIVFGLGSCTENDAVDTQYPEISMDFAEAFPSQCALVKRGEDFIFRARFSDNFQLGSFSLDIHHNFDHHTHSTEVNDCDMMPTKTPVNPFLLIESHAIPAGKTTYEAELSISVPEDIDPGDYHFLVKLTDHEGWQSLKGISLQIQ